MTTILNSTMRVLFPTAFFIVASAGMLFWVNHSAEQKAKQIAERDARCSQFSDTNSLFFKGDRDCVGWKRKTDIPLPIEA